MNRASIGVDLGGTSFAVGLLNAEGQLLHLRERDTQSFRPREEIVADIAKAVLEVAAEAGGVVQGLGLGFPGVIDAKAGVVLLPPNFGAGWKNFALAAALKAATGFATHLINDARAFTFAESRLGAGRGASDLLGITLGTGVGGGLLLDGELYLGRFGTAGEFGHQVVDAHGLDCGCGQRGCVEVYSSGPAIAGAAARPLRQGRAPKLRALIENDLNRLSPKMVVQAADQGDADCLEIVDRAALALAHGIVNVMTLLGLERVVIGGGVARAGETLFGPVRAHIARLLKMLDVPEVVPAVLAEPGVVGAAVWASEQVGKQGGGT